jgi:hypothetical protein
LISNLSKIYSPAYKKFRRFLINLFRPADANSKFFLLSSIDVAAYLILFLFFCSFGLFIYDTNYSVVPFMTGWIFILSCMIYFQLYPLTWDEMDENERKFYRQLWRLPDNWTPFQ